MFERPHHNRIAQVRHALNAPLLRESNCLFGGGTVIALRHGEYRESVDIDFLVSDIGSYRGLRQLLNGQGGIQAIVREGGLPLTQVRDVRADHGWLERCMQVMAMTLPKAVLWQKIRALQRVLP